MLHLISLGSSFAAGPGIEPVVATAAGRSANNYPSILAQLISCDRHTDLSYSGATLLNVYNTPQDAAPPQIEAIPTIEPGDRVIVTITAGGNDICYVGQIMMDSCRASWSDWLAGWYVGRQRSPALDALDEQGLVYRFQQVILAIRQRIPQAEIVLVGYLTLLGDDVTPNGNVPLSAPQIKSAQERSEMLRRAYRQAADGVEGCRFCDIASASKGYGIGASEQWVTGHRSVVGSRLWSTGAAAWHPNRKGMEAVAEIVRDFLVLGDLGA